jgi:VWFA-related protein
MVTSSGYRVFLSLGIVALLTVVDTTAQVFRQRVDLITVDVSVTRQDQPVTNLSASDFEVLVDGVSRRIVGFRRVQGPEGDGPDNSAPAERVVVLAVDRDTLRPRQGRAALDAAGAFIHSLAPSDQVAIWTLPASGDLQLTTDRAELQARLGSMEGTAPPRASMINLTADEAVSITAFRNQQTIEEVVDRECGRLANPGPVCQLEVEREAHRLHAELGVRAESAATSLRSLMRQLEGIDGPKHVVLISTGPPQLPNRLAISEELATAAATARVRLHSLQVPQDQHVIGTDAPGRLPLASSQHRSTGHFLADRTGGIALTPSAPRVGFARISSQLSGAYELGIQSTPADRDGRPHAILVRVATRRDVTVRARQQFTLPAHVSTAPQPTSSAPATVPDPGAAKVTPDAPPASVPTLKPSDLDPATALPRLVASIGAYVEAFQREFSSAVAQERYVQLIRPLRGTPTGPEDERALEWHEGQWDYPRSGVILDRRQLLSDVLLVHTRDGWIGYRDVAAVNGNAVRNRQDRVGRLFLSAQADRNDQLKRIAAESARYNLGGFTRTLNIPTLALSFLQRAHLPRFAFTLDGRTTIDGRDVQVVGFNERTRPSLIGTASGDDVPIEGRIWIEEATGVIRQTEVTVVAQGRRGRVVTRYREVPGFTILVPDYMWEWYDAGRRQVVGAVAAPTIVECLARYSAYRRFVVSTQHR